MADQDNQIKLEKSLNLRLMKQLNRSLEKSDDLTKEYNSYLNTSNKRLSKFSDGINNVNKFLTPGQLPKTLDNLNSKIKVFTKSFDGRIIPNKLNRLSSNLTNLNRLLENDVFNSFQDVSKAGRKKSSRSKPSASSGSPGSGAEDFFSPTIMNTSVSTIAGSSVGENVGLNTIYKNQPFPLGYNGNLPSKNTSRFRPSGPDLNTIYVDEPLQLNGPDEINGGGKARKKRAKSQGQIVKSMIVSKAVFETSVFNNAIFRGVHGLGKGKGSNTGNGSKNIQNVEDKRTFLEKTSEFVDGFFKGLNDLKIPISVEQEFIQGFFKTLPKAFKTVSGIFGKKDKADLLRTDDNVIAKRDTKRNVILSNMLIELKDGKNDKKDGFLSKLGGAAKALFYPLRLLGGLFSKLGGALFKIPGLLFRMSKGLVSLLSKGLGSLVGLGGKAVSGVGGLLAAGGTAVGSAGAGAIAGTVGIGAALGTAIGMAITEVIEKKFPNFGKKIDSFFAGVAGFFSEDVDTALKNKEKFDKENKAKQIKALGTESVMLFERADKLKEQAKAARNEVFGMFGSNEEEATKLESQAMELSKKAAESGAKYRREQGLFKGVTGEITTPTEETIQRVEVEPNTKSVEDKTTFEEFLLGPFIDTLVAKLQGGSFNSPNNQLGINAGG